MLNEYYNRVTLSQNNGDSKTFARDSVFLRADNLYFPIL